MSSERSLCDLNDEVIGNVIYFTPHIWDVLNFTATSRRLNTLSERHLKTMKYLDIRIPYLAKSESAGIIEEGIRTLCLRRCGNQLTEITIMKPERWREDTEFIRSLQLLPHTLLKMIEGDEQLEDLRYQLFSNEDAIAKQRKITMSTLEMSILSVKLDKSDRSVITGLQRDFNAVKRLDIIFSKQEWEINLIAKCFPLFPNIEALGIQFEEGAYPKFGKLIIKLITLLSRIDKKVQVKIRHWLVLDFPAFFARLKDYLPRLQIYKSIGTKRPLMYPGSGLKSYQEVETVLSDQFYSRYRQVFLQAVSRHKDITDLSHRAEEVICFHGEYTETLTLSLYHIEPLERQRLFKTIGENCPNFRNVNLSFSDNSEDRIVDFFERFGHTMEKVTIYYFEDGRLSFEMFMMILDHCPKLTSFESNGILAEDVQQYAELNGRSRQVRHLEYVKLHMGLDPDDPLAFTLVYLNGKMASTDQKICYHW